MPQTPSSTAASNTELLDALRRLHAGDLTVHLPETGDGTAGELATLFNRHVKMVNTFAGELTTVSRDLGTEGRFGGQMEVPDAEGTWHDLTQNVNQMSANLTDQVRDLARQTTAFANGDFAPQEVAPAQGEMAEFHQTLRVMNAQMQQLCAEVERVTREVGTEGRFGPQMEVRGVSGEWQTLTQNVNTMVVNLTNQIRDLSHTTRAAVDNKPLRILTCGAQGEMAELFTQVGTVTERAVAPSTS